MTHLTLAIAARWRRLRPLALVAGLLLGCLPAWAQLNYTTLTASTGTWSSIYGAGGGTSLLPDLQNGDPDDDITFDKPIGFTFSFQGVGYDRFILATNGFIKLGTVAPAYYGGTAPTSTAGSILREVAWQNNNTLAAFNADLVPGALGENDYLYKLTGAAGSRVLTVEWHDVSEYSIPAQFSTFSFQLKLYEGSNSIEFVYGPMTTAGTATLKVGNVGIRGQSTLGNQLLYVSKSSAAAWNVATALNPAATSGGYGAGAFNTNAFNYRNTVKPSTGLTYRFVPTTARTNNVSVASYALGSMANNQGMPYAVQARVTNETATATGPFQVQLAVSGTLQQNGNPVAFNFTDNQTVTLAGATGNPSSQISFAPFTPPLGATGNLTVTVTAQNAGDQATADNVATTTLTLTATESSYNTPAAEDGGLGLNGAYGEYIARFHVAAAQQLTGVQVAFKSSGREYQVVVFGDNGPGGTPGTLLYESAVGLTVTNTLVTVPISPAITVAGDFFVGIRQSTTNNVTLSYELESPVRANAFFYRGSVNLPITASWGDFAEISYPFRPAIGATFAVPTNLVPGCAFITSPANNATGVPINGSIVFGSGGGNPTGYDVYLSTSQTAVLAEAPAARVATNIPGSAYNFQNLASLTDYYYKVVARNANGASPNCAVQKFTTAMTPANDNCANAALLTVKASGACGAGTLGSTESATEDAGVPDPTCSGGSIRDVWYKFSTGTYGTVNISLTGGTASGQLGFQLLSGCGGSTVGCVQNALDTTFTFGQPAIQPNTTYWLRVFTNTSLVPGPVPGTFTVCVSGPAGLLPTITDFTPTTAPTGSSVVITGTNFTGATSVRFNGVDAASYVVNSATQITATVPATASTGKITVTTSVGVGTSAASFKVGSTFGSFSPATGAPGTSVTITGSGFSGATAVRFGGVAATSYTVVNATTITATVPALALTGRISVVTVGSLATSTTNFTVAPIVTGFTPDQGAPGSLVVVSGLNLFSGSVVSFNGVSATTTYNNTRQLTAVVPAGATTGPLTVTNPNGTATSAAPFTVMGGAVPTITTFSPGSGLIGDVVTITGTNFTGATSVRFNTASAPVTVLSATQVQATVPAGATTGKLYVVTPAGMAVSATNFTAILSPTITTFAPASGLRGATVQIFGANFANATSVTIGGAAATFTIDYSFRITATVPLTAVTGNITVTTVAGTATSANTFTVTGPRPTSSGSPAPRLPLELTLYPNPARDWLDIQLTGAAGPTPFEVFNALGQVVRRGVLQDEAGRLSVADLPAGRYVVRVAGRTQALLIGE